MSLPSSFCGPPSQNPGALLALLLNGVYGEMRNIV